MAATRTPRPICAGFVPPRKLDGALEPWMSWLRVSWNTVFEALKPVVLTLAMLLPTTSIMVWLARRPLMPEYRERSNVFSFWRRTRFLVPLDRVVGASVRLGCRIRAVGRAGGAGCAGRSAQAPARTVVTWESGTFSSPIVSVGSAVRLPPNVAEATVPSWLVPSASTHEIF